MKQTNKTEYFHVHHYSQEYILKPNGGQEVHFLQLPKGGVPHYSYGVSSGFGNIMRSYPEGNTNSSLYRVAVTPEEIAHLEACIQAGAYVKMPETKSLFQIY